jgi:cytochrome P450
LSIFLLQQDTSLLNQPSLANAPAEDFRPPCPTRDPGKVKVFRLLKKARKNYLAIWSIKDFDQRLIDFKILNRQLMVCNDPDVVKEAFQTNHQALQRKTPQMRNALSPLIGDGLFISDGEIWTARRKIVAPIIHGSRVPSFVPIMIETIEEKKHEWMALEEGAEIDALSEMAHLTAEIICRTIFGQDLGREFATEVVEAFSDYQRHIDQIDLVSLLGLPEWLPRFTKPSVRKSIKRIHTVLDQIIDRYAHTKSEGSVSVLGGLLEACDEDGTPLSREAIRNEAAVIFMAGHETTANTLAWAWYLLSQSPRVAEQLTAELDSVLGNKPLAFSEVRKLSYTKAVVEETLRLYPPVPILGREAIEATSIDGHPVGKGTLLLVVPWLLQRNSNLWNNPHVFHPERHLEPEASLNGEKRSKYSYVPFSIGPRICPGLAFGMTEAILSLAILARDLELRLKPGEDVQPVCRLTVRPGDTLPMTVHHRNRQEP